jgi:hypothetical protein
MSVTCDEGGLLVGSDLPIPIDPARARAPGEKLGCSSIRCETCHSPVKRLDGFRTTRQLPPADRSLAMLHESMTPEGWPLRKDGAYRTYLCKCSWTDTSGIKYISSLDYVGDWQCQGH